MILRWQGRAYEVPLGLRTSAPICGTNLKLAVWMPGEEPGRHPTQWIADCYLPGTAVSLQAMGETAQDALDALQVMLPVQNMVRGGVC